jgi:hypothetical protein
MEFSGLKKSQYGHGSTLSLDYGYRKDEKGDFLQGLNELNTAISLMQKIPLSEMSLVKLMNRTDVKYIVNANLVPTLMRRAAKDYFIQEINGKFIAKYDTIYLDTNELHFFRAHMNGKLNRFKWRIRTYIESNLSFLEVKNKSKTDRTEKSRIVIEKADSLILDPAASFIINTSCTDPNLLVKVLQNNFNRLTMVNVDKTERLTIDFNISFKNRLNGKTAHFPNLCIIEIKQERFSESHINQYLNDMRIKKAGISKYCLGIAMTADNVKGNLYKQKIRYIQKITNT